MTSLQLVNGLEPEWAQLYQDGRSTLHQFLALALSYQGKLAPLFYCRSNSHLIKLRCGPCFKSKQLPHVVLGMVWQFPPLGS